jgi:nicotinic acid phosphoribosyltransferase
MTVAELIQDVTRCVRNSFYCDKPVQQFKRDERAIQRAIARYGVECERRGWHFQVDFIFHELLQLLKAIRIKEADIKYLPVYLEGAVDRHIRTRAEELSAAAKVAGNLSRRAVAGLAVTTVVEPHPVETLALLYKDLKKRQPKAKPAKVSQGSLL